MSTWIPPSYQFYLTNWEIQEIYRRLDNNETLKNIRQEFNISEDHLNHLFISWEMKQKYKKAINIVQNGKNIESGTTG